MRLRNPKVQDIEGLATLLNQAGVDFGVEDVADALWLASQMGDIAQSDRPETQEGQNTGSSRADIREEFIDNDPTEQDANRVQMSLPKGQTQKTGGSASGSGVPIKAPAAPALRIRLDLARALRPLRRQVPFPGHLEFDEEATMVQIADQQIWVPVLKPASERWLDVALVVEEMDSLPLWKETIAEFHTLLERQGAFRQVSTWRLRTELGKKPQLFSNWRDASLERRSQQTKQLIDPSGRRLILLLSDCTSQAWYTGSLLSWLETCTKQAPTAVIQLLPERLWPQSALSQGTPMWLSALEPGTTSAKLRHQYRTPLLQQILSLEVPTPTKLMTVPVVPLEAVPLKEWAKMVAGIGDSRAVGMQFDLEAVRQSAVNRNPEETDGELDAVNRVQRFRTTVSLMAQTLAGLMSEAPVSPPIVNLIRQTLLPKAEPVHVAEVFMGGLMKSQTLSGGKTGRTPTVQYDFVPGVRDILSDSVTKSASESVLNAVSRYISERLGLNIKSFEALLRIDFQGNPEAQEMVIPFAEIAAGTLMRMGGEFVQIAEQIATGPKIAPPSPIPDPDDLFPLLQTFSFREAILEFASEPDPNRQELIDFEFETVSLIVERQRGRKAPQITRQRRKGKGRQWIENLGQGIDIEMVLIPSGTFVMGSPETETGRSPSESPQHEVTIAVPFLMSKYPITQAQWRAVADLPQEERELDPDPSSFKGDNRPVENIDWYAAVEFCQRLSQQTGQDYRLPSEAEWEYACRAGSSTPFHYGETIISDLANYDGTIAYGDGPTGEYREQTTEVGTFPANAFGLSDMHGNVWEWCQDTWLGSYKGAPEDGSAWITENDNDYRVLRGGSWNDNPENCRSADRYGDAPDNWFNVIGLRVVCGVART